MHWNAPNPYRSAQVELCLVNTVFAIYNLCARLALLAAGARPATMQTTLHVWIKSSRYSGYISNRSEFEMIFTQLALLQRAGDSYAIIRDGENMQIDITRESTAYGTGYRVTAKDVSIADEPDSFKPTEYRMKREYFLVRSFRLIVTATWMTRTHHDIHGKPRIKQLVGKITPQGRRLNSKERNQFMAIHRMLILDELEVIAQLIEQQHPLPAS